MSTSRRCPIPPTLRITRAVRVPCEPAGRPAGSSIVREEHATVSDSGTAHGPTAHGPAVPPTGTGAPAPAGAPDAAVGSPNGAGAAPATGTARVKRGMAEMLKGGVIMDVVTP